MEGLLGGNTTLQIAIVVIALVVLLFAARFVVNLAVTAVRFALGLAVAALVLYLVYLIFVR